MGCKGAGGSNDDIDTQKRTRVCVYIHLCIRVTTPPPLLLDPTIILQLERKENRLRKKKRKETNKFWDKNETN